MISELLPVVGEDLAISTVHPDIIQTHILTRLDGPTLASAACASSGLHTLSSNNTLWREICNMTWPSTADPCVRHVISSFPFRHRSFYSDSFPALHVTPPNPRTSIPPSTSELISAVDLCYKNRLILSSVRHTETKTGWFMSSPFRINVLDPKETVQTGVKLEIDNDISQLSLSWILIDPARSRAANIPSLKPVLVTRHWLTGDLHVQFATILPGDEEGEHVQCAAVVTCGGREGAEVQVKEVSLVVEDMDGRNLNGEESLVILQNAIMNGERRPRRGDGMEERKRYEEYMDMRRERREKKQRKEKRMEIVCIFIVITVLMACGSCFYF